MGYVWTIMILTAVYLALSGNLALNNVLVGLMIAAFVAILLRPASSPVRLRRLPVALWGVIRYAGLLAWDIVRSGIGVAAVVLNPRLPIRPGILAVPSECESELGVALSSHALSVTPGELVLGVDDEGVLYVHCLDASHAEETIEAAHLLRRRLLSQILD